MKRLKRETILVLSAGLTLGFFVVMVFQKIGIFNFWLMPSLLLLGAVSSLVSWQVWGAVFSKIIKKEKITVLKYDAISFIPFFLTLLMIARKYLNIPHMGTFLTIITVLMNLWIKVCYADTMIKGRAYLSRWTFAVPLGFIISLFTQFLSHDFNLARFLVLGQVFALICLLVISGKKTMRKSFP